MWAGTKWAVLWQESHDGTGTDTNLHLTTKVPAGVALDTDIKDQWDPPITDFTSQQPGELDMVWTGSRLGIVIMHDGMMSGKNIYFAEFSSEGIRISDDAIKINDPGTSNFNPSLTYLYDDPKEYYLFAWLLRIPHRFTIST